MLKLETTPMTDVPPVRVLELPAGQCTTVWDDLEDKTNDNSCVVSYYQVGRIKAKSYKKDLCMQILAQFFEEPFFDDLRTKQQLGYVVAARHSTERETYGVWFLV